MDQMLMPNRKNACISIMICLVFVFGGVACAILLFDKGTLGAWMQLVVLAVGTVYFGIEAAKLFSLMLTGFPVLRLDGDAFVLNWPVRKTIRISDVQSLRLEPSHIALPGALIFSLASGKQISVLSWIFRHHPKVVLDILSQRLEK
ncbi:MAG: hypothetical protein EON58_12910 [Alphaproteobacteria bacterium]|nr:MAG: hypothetical protein EON58_12910 [Alphaproteobacteria bacterium]